MSTPPKQFIMEIKGGNRMKKRVTEKVIQEIQSLGREITDNYEKLRSAVVVGNDDIHDSFAEVPVEGVGVLGIAYNESRQGMGFFSLVILDEEYQLYRYFGGKPEVEWHAFGDFEMPRRNASREQYLAVLNHLEEVRAAFQQVFKEVSSGERCD